MAIVYTEGTLSHLDESRMQVFDILIPLPVDVPPGFSAKLRLNTLSPFEETIFFDADMLWLPYHKPSELFDECAKADYTGITEGWYDIDKKDKANLNPGYWFWADHEEIISTYKLKGKLHQWRSEFMYFKKSKKVDQFFAEARKINATQQLKSVMRFGNDIPDVLGINISSNLHGISPHRPRWTPAYWHKTHGDRSPDNIEQWFLVSFGGNSSNGNVKRMYDAIAKQALTKLGRQHLFSLHDKAHYLPERAKM